jgi:urea transport system substrate-binding protein
MANDSSEPEPPIRSEPAGGEEFDKSIVVGAGDATRAGALRQPLAPAPPPGPTAPIDTSVDRERIGYYRILKVLGKGGMGVVYQAEDTRLQRVVALKIILPQHSANPKFRERFLREARASASVKDDHVVTVYHVGQDGSVPFLAMEYLEGETLQGLLERGEPIPLREALRIGWEIASGLAAAHEKGLVHRDVKPSNIWLEAPTGRAKLLDFGLVHAGTGHTGLTQTGVVVGTPEFMAPEQARGEEVDARSDLFSLGAILYTLCSGQKPFQGTSVMAVLSALALDRPRPLTELNPDIPPALVDLIGRLLEKKPAHRPSSAAEVRDAIEAIEASLPPLTDSVMRARWRTRSGTKPVSSTLFRRPAKRPVPWFGLIAAGVGLVGLAIVSAWSFSSIRRGARFAGASPIRVGVLHSRTGTMAISERPVIDAVLLAIEEINARGGVLGRPIEPVLADGKSDELVFAAEAERLITEERVATLFGCWTSASRKSVVPVVERHNHLLFYPVQYEGMEQSPNVIYLGPVPNQQILPALRWLVGFEGKKRWFLIGSEYVFPVTANAVIRDEAKARGATIVGEEYVLLGNTELSECVEKIADADPDLIINTINGDTNIGFFRALRRAGIKPAATPTLSVSISEEELNSLDAREIEGDYVAANYFRSVDTPQNRSFRDRFARRFGADRTISNPMESAYMGMQIWANAVQAAGRPDPIAIRDAAKGLTYDGPQGTIKIDPRTQHTVQTARVGRVDHQEQLVEVYVSPFPIVPEPFPTSRTRQEWMSFVEALHKRWGGRWSNPGL